MPMSKIYTCIKCGTDKEVIFNDSEEMPEIIECTEECGGTMIQEYTKNVKNNIHRPHVNDPET